MPSSAVTRGDRTSGARPCRLRYQLLSGAIPKGIPRESTLCALYCWATTEMKCSIQINYLVCCYNDDLKQYKLVIVNDRISVQQSNLDHVFACVVGLQ